MKKILFIHGLASSGAYKTADTLRILLKPVEVIAPDVPIDPCEALQQLRTICAEESPDMIVGLSLGGFWAQQLRGIPRILINPDLHPSVLLSEKKGEMKYLSPRRDGAESFVIDEKICEGYRTNEACEFEGLTAEDAGRVYGMFADSDELVHCRDEFALHYPGRAVDYPGTHLPTYPQIKTFLLPLAKELIDIL